MNTIENPLQLVAFGLAVWLSIIPFMHQFFKRFKKFGMKSQTFAPVLFGFLIAVGALFSYIHNQSGENIAWLYSSEAVDRGLFEWLTALCLIITCIWSIRMTRMTGGLQRTGFVALAVASLFIAGEEMSWGQWIFHWDTPEAMSQINLQNETNLHNLVNPRIYDLIYYAIGYAVLIGAMLAYFRFPNTGDTARQSSFNQLMTSAGNWLRNSRIGLVTTLGAATLFQHEQFEEYAEFVLIFAVTLFMLHHFRIAKQAKA